MTPSEISEALEARHKYDKINYPPASPLDRQAAATIRAQAEALKIATEALEPLANMAAVVGSAADDVVYVGQSGHRLTYGDFRRAAQSLARIKEV